ncbi:MAG: hypothetical protein NZM35_12385 [Chitinophagales bacterium]|nr:hypothetical protein [Chitinophagales bacterium]MDW8420212.1 hypothetical protein [Chitinophagales bacterium]
MKNLQTRAKELFDKNTEKEVVYATADGYLFFEKTKAEAHAGTLSDRKVQTITREQANAVEPVVADPQLPVPPATNEQLMADATNQPDVDTEMAALNTASVEPIKPTKTKKK